LASKSITLQEPKKWIPNESVSVALQEEAPHPRPQFRTVLAASCVFFQSHLRVLFTFGFIQTNFVRPFSMLSDLIAQLLQNLPLSSSQAHQALQALLSPDLSNPHKADFLRALRKKGESASEIAAFAQGLLAQAIPIPLSSVPGPILDVCGTGGDQRDFFNISTTSMFILAAGGVCVVKHGNRAITSQCGGADVLEELGVTIDLSPTALGNCIERHGLGFVFAPHYHPAFKTIAPLRKQLAAEGCPTIFNLLGPLLNPVAPPFQLVGVFSPSLLPVYRDALALLGRTRAWALHGDGTDELSTTGPASVYETGPAGSSHFTLDPTTLGLPIAQPDQLKGGDRHRNAEILVRVLNGSESGARTDVALLNASAGFVLTGIQPDLASGLAYAREQIQSGRAAQKLEALRSYKP
jgi:anthranilate phosphoribosyltransferase